MRKFTAAILFSMALTPTVLHAQTTREIIYRATGNVKASGDFPDSLLQYDKKTGLFYFVANDSNDLYVFIKVHDKRTQNKIIVGGITTAINAKGKKKARTTITFPVIDQQAYLAQISSLRNAHTPLEDNEIMKEHRDMLSRLNEIKVAGLRNIPNETISTLNQYGIQAKIFYDPTNNIVYRLTIPFKYTGLSMQLKNDVAVNIKVNGFSFKDTGEHQGGNTRSWSQGGGRIRGERTGDDRGMGRGGSGRWQHRGSYGGSSISKGPVSFWIKAPLAK